MVFGNRRLPLTEDVSQMANNDTVNAAATSSHPLIAPAGNRVIAGRHERPGTRVEKPEPMAAVGHEEVLVVDDRAGLRPAQVVESKLSRLLQDASLRVSHLQMRGLLRTR
jgi:hypothetical protein